MLWIVASVDERDTKRSQATMLGVSLFQVTQSSHKLFAGYVFVVREKISLSGLAGVIDENVGIGSHACNGTDHITGSDGQHSVSLA